MPAKSAKQYGMMAAIAHGAKSKTGVGPSQAVAKEFVDKTPSDKRSMFMKHLKKGKKR
jgi:hypothetical protein